MSISYEENSKISWKISGFHKSNFSIKYMKIFCFLISSFWDFNNFNSDVPYFLSKKEYNIELIETGDLDPRSGNFDLSRINVLEAWVVIIVCSFDDPNSADNILLKWIPEIENHKKKAPVMIICNKYDLRNDESKFQKIENDLYPYNQIEFFLELISNNQDEILNLIGNIRTIAIYPRQKLIDFDAQDKYTLSPSVIRALKRIYDLSDQDQDGYLGYQDLLSLDSKCFYEAQLKAGKFIKLKDLVLENEPEGFVEGKGFSFRGFLTIWDLLLKKGRSEIFWALLRHFNYNDMIEISLPSEVVNIVEDSELRKVVCLSEFGKDFLMKYYKFKLAKISRMNLCETFELSQKDFLDIFSFFPDEKNPWEAFGFPDFLYYEDESKNISANNWCHLWDLLVRVQPTEAIKALAYLGYKEFTSQDFITSLLLSSNSKTVLTVLVGPQGSGKSEILNFFLLRNFGSKKIAWAASLPNGKSDNTLILTTDISMVSKANVICVCCDCKSDEFFSEALMNAAKYRQSGLPVIILRTKYDHSNSLDPALFNILFEKGFFYSHISSKMRYPQGIFKIIFDIGFKQISPGIKPKEKKPFALWIATATTLATFMSVGCWIYKSYRKSSN